jgi:hypothetical protein
MWHMNIFNWTYTYMLENMIRPCIQNLQCSKDMEWKGQDAFASENSSHNHFLAFLTEAVTFLPVQV